MSKTQDCHKIFSFFYLIPTQSINLKSEMPEIRYFHILVKVYLGTTDLGYKKIAITDHSRILCLFESFSQESCYRPIAEELWTCSLFCTHTTLVPVNKTFHKAKSPVRSRQLFLQFIFICRATAKNDNSIKTSFRLAMAARNLVFRGLSIHFLWSKPILPAWSDRRNN